LPEPGHDLVLAPRRACLEALELEERADELEYVRVVVCLRVDTPLSRSAPGASCRLLKNPGGTLKKPVSRPSPAAWPAAAISCLASSLPRASVNSLPGRLGALWAICASVDVPSMSTSKSSSAADSEVPAALSSALPLAVSTKTSPSAPKPDLPCGMTGL
jgi:hypothetical protein